MSDLTEKKMHEIIIMCNKNCQYMWAAKIISILLVCDFRDAKVESDKWIRRHCHWELV